MLEAEGRLPDIVVACIGGGSNAMGLFHPFLDDRDVRVIGVEAGGKGVDEKVQHCASLTGGRPGVLHGNRTYLLLEGYSISAGLDYPGIGPEHSWLRDAGRAEYVSVTDDEALAAFQLCCEKEGIIPALEPSHALAHVARIAGDLPKDRIICMNMCGRGDKDIFTVAKLLDRRGRTAPMDRDRKTIGFPPQPDHWPSVSGILARSRRGIAKFKLSRRRSE